MSLKRNTMWNLVGAGLPLLVGIITIPYLVKHLGVEAFGILSIIWVLIGYFSLFDLGLGRAMTQQVSLSIASENQCDIAYLVKSGIIFTLYTGLVGGVILAAISFPLGHIWLKVSSSLQKDTADCLLVAALGIPLATVTTGLRGVIEAYEDFKSVNLLRIALGVANFSFPALSVMFFGPSLTYVVITLIGARLLALLGHLILVNKRINSNWTKNKARAGDIKSLLSFGVWMTVSNIIGPLMATADRFIIAAVLGASSVAYYTVPSDMLMRVLVLPTALTSALFPRLASTLVADLHGANVLYLKSRRLVAVVLAVLCLVIACGSYWGLLIWLGKDFASKSWIITSVLSFGILLNGLAFVPYTVIQATGNARITAYFHIFELMIYLPVLFVFLNYFGLIGVAIAWVMRVGLDLVLLLTFARNYFRNNNIIKSARAI